MSNRKPPPAPPPVGAVVEVLKQCGYSVYHDENGESKTRSLGPGTLVEVVSHTPGALYFGPGCYVTPIKRHHKWYGTQFYIPGNKQDCLDKE